MEGPGGKRNSAAPRPEPELHGLNGSDDSAINARKALAQRVDRVRLLSTLCAARGREEPTQAELSLDGANFEQYRIRIDRIVLFRLPNKKVKKVRLFLAFLLP